MGKYIKCLFIQRGQDLDKIDNFVPVFALVLGSKLQLFQAFFNLNHHCIGKKYIKSHNRLFQNHVGKNPFVLVFVYLWAHFWVLVFVYLWAHLCFTCRIVCQMYKSLYSMKIRKLCINNQKYSLNCGHILNYCFWLKSMRSLMLVLSML